MFQTIQRSLILVLLLTALAGVATIQMHAMNALAKSDSQKDNEKSTDKDKNASDNKNKEDKDTKAKTDGDSKTDTGAKVKTDDTEASHAKKDINAKPDTNTDEKPDTDEKKIDTNTDPSTSDSSSENGQGSLTSEKAKVQPDRVGIHDNDQQTSGEGANKGGTVTDPTLCNNTDNSDCKTTVKADCFGKVIQHRAQEHKDNPDEGTLGSHTRDPVPELPGNETPRQGIGNQDQGHPAAHGAFNSQFDEDDEQNVVENC
jgi:cytoskeletal protein RodZ